MPQPRLSSRGFGWAQRYPPPGISPTNNPWWDRAACRKADPRLFDYGEDREGTRLRRIATALRYCGDCLVTKECLEDAIRLGDSGVRGGQFLNSKRVNDAGGHY